MTCIPDKYKYGASRGLYKTTRFLPVTWIRKLSITWNMHSKRDVSQELGMNTEPATNLTYHPLKRELIKLSHVKN